MGKKNQNKQTNKFFFSVDSQHLRVNGCNVVTILQRRIPIINDRSNEHFLCLRLSMAGRASKYLLTHIVFESLMFFPGGKGRGLVPECAGVIY